MDEEALITWQDVLDEIVAGRSGDLVCPLCGHRPLNVIAAPGGVTKVSCTGCGKYIEGRFGGP